MNVHFQKAHLPFYIGIIFFLSIVILEIISILNVNSGFFVYTLDDPYIHLALAENLQKGHYGINAQEFSAPSSSIIWPFILAPFANFTFFPLVANCVFAIVTICLFVRILENATATPPNAFPVVHSLAVVLLILVTNIVGIVFTGMEHSLQVLLVVSIVYGLIIEVKENRVSPWLLAAIVLAPLVRYECIAVSLAALMYLIKRRHYSHALTAGVLIGIGIGVFSIFLIQSGVGPFSASIVAKSSVVEDGGTLRSLLSNLERSLFAERQGLVLVFTMIALLAYGLISRDIKRRALAVAASIAILLHLGVGRFGWYHRYEIYIWAFSLLLCLYLWLPMILRFVKHKPAAYLWSAKLFICLVIALAGEPYIKALFTLPHASNNIYEQQYQMHRFVADYYQRPVAVNDLGYVCYQNNHYVLDLWGLGSHTALEARLHGQDNDWMSTICRQSNVGLVMIYDSWFNNIPDEWIKIGTLHLNNRQVTVSRDTVTFYGTNRKFSEEIIHKLYPFIRTLPPGVEFAFETGIIPTSQRSFVNW